MEQMSPRTIMLQDVLGIECHDISSYVVSDSCDDDNEWHTGMMGYDIDY